MTELVEWLRAQLDEDERIATDAAGPVGPGWYWLKSGRLLTSAYSSDHIAEVGDAQCGPHLATHDPARVLREVAAKRRVLKFAEQLDYGLDEAMLLRLLALPYADRPGYRQEEWAP